MAFPPVTVAAITGDAIVSNSLEPLARGKSTGVLYSEKNSPMFGRVKRELGRKMRPTWPLSRVLMVPAFSLVTLSVPEGEGGSRQEKGREWREKEGVEGEGEGRREWRERKGVEGEEGSGKRNCERYMCVTCTCRVK